MSFADKLTVWIQRWKLLIIVVWVAAGITAAFYPLKFIHSTTQSFDPPPGTQASRAIEAMRDSFPDFARVSHFSVFIQCASVGGGDGGGGPTEGCGLTTSPLVELLLSRVAQGVTKSQYASLVRESANYFLLKAAGASVLAELLVADNGTAMAAPFVFGLPFTKKESGDFGEKLVDIVHGELKYVKELFYRNTTDKTKPFPWTAEVNGLPVFVKDIIAAVERDMGLMDAIVMPLALAVMAFTVKSVRVMVLPLATVGMTLLISFAIMYGITKVAQVDASTPSLMMSLSVAMSVDYNLFIMSRYLEELRSGLRGSAVVANTLASSGRTVLISGLTLMLSFLSLVAFPLAILRSFGYGCALAILTAMAVSLTFVPAVLLMFPGFFEEAALPIKRQSWYLKLVALKTKKKNTSSPAGSPSRSTNERTPLSRTHPRSQQPQPQGSRTPTPPPESSSDTLEGSPNVTLLSASNNTQKQTPKKLSGLTGLSMSTVANSNSGRFSAADHNRHDTDSHSFDGFAGWTSSVFYKLRRVLRFPLNLIVLLLLIGVTAAVGVQTLKFKTTDSFKAYLARGSPSQQNFNQFAAAFGYGYSEPYNVLLKANQVDPTGQYDTVTGEPFFDYAQGFFKYVVKHQPSSSTFLPLVSSTSTATVVADGTGTSATTSLVLPCDNRFNGVFVLDGEWTTYEQFSVCVNGTKAKCNKDLLLLMTTVSKEYESVYVTDTISCEPTGNQGNQFYHGMLSLRDRYEAMHPEMAKNWSIYFSGVGPSSMDAMDVIFSDFPYIMVGAAGAILLIIGVSFKSIVVPLRSLVSVALTEAFVFGIIVLTFQMGFLDWTGWANLSSQGAVTFSSPIVGFTVVVGVALDYDVFLLSRIADVVAEGNLDTRTAVLQGLCHTGRIITAAGIVMAIAFFGLVLSSVGVLNVLGWFMCTAVLFDTFIVRTLVVPTFMSLLGRWNWWPSKVAQDTI